MPEIHKDNLSFPGDYNLDNITLINSVGERLGLRLGTVAELNVYEDINSHALTGSMHVVDAHNIITNAQLQGNERLAFKLSTPGAANKIADTVDASEETGHPFYIYALTDRINLTETTMTYTLHFCSRELFRNARTRVSKAYNGSLSLSVLRIMRDEDGIDSKKDIYFEPTRNQDKIVVPNIRPFDAVNMISTRALSKNAKGAGYYFFETTKGFHFRSYESMIAMQGLYDRPEEVTLFFEPKTAGKKSRRIHANEHAIESYEFVQHFDTLSQQAMGTYANRVITHNIYDKSYDIKDYHYHNYFADMQHLANTGTNATKRNFHISDTPVDNDPKDDGRPGDKTVSDYPESHITLQPSTRFLHNEDTGIFGTSPDNEGLIEGIRLSQENQVDNSTKVRIVIPGHSYLQAGDIIRFQLPSMEPDKGEKTGYGFDAQHSGRYLISKLRHRVIRGEYKLVLECIKDSVMRQYQNTLDGKYQVNENQKGRSKDIYELDSGQISQRMGPHG